MKLEPHSKQYHMITSHHNIDDGDGGDDADDDDDDRLLLIDRKVRLTDHNLQH